MFSEDMKPEDEHIEPTSDDNFEEAEIEDIEDADEHKAQKLRKELRACQDARQQAQDELQRTKADFLNARRRLEEAKEADKARNEIKWIEKLLPLCDSFAMAMSNKAVWESVDAGWRTGVEGIYQQLQTLLAEHEVTPINPEGHAFDPNEHEALGTEPAEDAEPDTVLRVIQMGYKHKGTVIRPAKVIITS